MTWSCTPIRGSTTSSTTGSGRSDIRGGILPAEGGAGFDRGTFRRRAPVPAESRARSQRKDFDLFDSAPGENVYVDNTFPYIGP